MLCRRCPYFDSERDTWVVQLTRGLEAFIDEEDVETVSGWTWCALRHHGNTFYAQANVCGNRVLLHRFILGKAAPPLVDHINGNGLDCRRNNLRAATPAQSQANRSKERRNSTGFKGVTTNSRVRGWIAQLHQAGVTHYLGTHPSAEEAALRYDCAAREFFGHFARLNFPLEGPDGHLPVVV